MANDIAAFFAAEPDPAAGAEQVANHLKKFWEPRMRVKMIAHVADGGAGLGHARGSGHSGRHGQPVA